MVSDILNPFARDLADDDRGEIRELAKQMSPQIALEVIWRIYCFFYSSGVSCDVPAA